MTKRTVNLALVYALLAMAAGVFFREFTKFSGYEGATYLTKIHPHYFMLGVGGMLLALLLDKNFGFAGAKRMKATRIFYHTGLNLTAAMFLLRGILQVLETPLTSGANAALSGIAGIGHILLGVGIFLALLGLRGKIVKS